FGKGNSESAPESVQMGAGLDDFAERASVSRSTLRATDSMDLLIRWALGKVPAGQRPVMFGTQDDCGILPRAPCEERAGRESERGEIDIKRLLSPALLLL